MQLTTKHKHRTPATFQRHALILPMNPTRENRRSFDRIRLHPPPSILIGPEGWQDTAISAASLRICVIRGTAALRDQVNTTTASVSKVWPVLSLKDIGNTGSQANHEGMQQKGYYACPVSLPSAASDRSTIEGVVSPTQ